MRFPSEARPSFWDELLVLERVNFEETARGTSPEPPFPRKLGMTSAAAHRFRELVQEIQGTAVPLLIGYLGIIRLKTTAKQQTNKTSQHKPKQSKSKQTQQTQQSKQTKQANQTKQTKNKQRRSNTWNKQQPTINNQQPAASNTKVVVSIFSHYLGKIMEDLPLDYYTFWSFCLNSFWHHIASPSQKTM